MSVEEETNIRILDPRKLDAQARKTIREMEDIRKRLEAEAKKATKAINQVSGPAQDIMNQQQGRTGFPGKILADSGLLSGAGAPMERSNPFKELREQVRQNTQGRSELDKKMDKTIMGLQEAQGILNSPFGFMMGKAKAQLPMTLLKFTIIGAIVATVAQQVFKMVKDSFGPGGINDVRKRVLDEAQTIPDLENLIAIRNGSVFFTSDVRVRQKVAQSSNTENLDMQSQRFNEFALGREITT